MSGYAESTTMLLVAWQNGDEQAIGRLIVRIYDELRSLAASHLRREWRHMSLETTDLVHATFLRLTCQERVRWKNRRHFFGTAALIMRRLIVDYARRHQRKKRSGLEVPLDEELLISEERAAELVHLDEALRRLEEKEPRFAHIVELRFFAGLSCAEIAELLGVSKSTVQRRWYAARNCLHGFLTEDNDDQR